jgi:glycine/D-amino acid oxidase-like deaminating enzyme
VAAYVAGGVRASGGALLNPNPDGTVLVGSSREPAIAPEPGDADAPRRQVAEAIELVPSLADAVVLESWWGVRPMSPDERPLIGPLRDGLFVATGHGSEGVILAGGTGTLVADLVTGTSPSIDPAPFDPRRFAS